MWNCQPWFFTSHQCPLLHLRGHVSTSWVWFLHFINITEHSKKNETQVCTLNVYFKFNLKNKFSCRATNWRSLFFNSSVLNNNLSAYCNSRCVGEKQTSASPPGSDFFGACDEWLQPIRAQPWASERPWLAVSCCRWACQSDSVVNQTPDSICKACQRSTLPARCSVLGRFVFHIVVLWRLIRTMKQYIIITVCVCVWGSCIRRRVLVWLVRRSESCWRSARCLYIWGFFCLSAYVGWMGLQTSPQHCRYDCFNKLRASLKSVPNRTADVSDFLHVDGRYAD